MIEALFSILVKLAGIYLLAGLVVSVLFFTRWLKVIDPAAVGGSRGFKVLITPGVIVIWPVILKMAFRRNFDGGAGGAEALRRNHRVAVILLALVGALLFTAALVWRAPALGDLPSVEIQTP